MMIRTNEQSLAKVDTDWALLKLVHESTPLGTGDAWNRLLHQYDRPITRFLRHLVRDEDVARELSQEFWHRFLRGDYAVANPERGRFRNLLKTVLVHLVADHYRGRRPSRALVEPDVVSAEDTLLDDLTNRYVVGWRKELIGGVWDRMEADERERGHVGFQVLMIEIENPGLTSPEKAELLSRHLGRRISSENFRQMLSRARRRFAEFVLDAVTRSLAEPNAESIREELAELNLLKYCEPLLRADDVLKN